MRKYTIYYSRQTQGQHEKKNPKHKYYCYGTQKIKMKRWARVDQWKTEEVKM